MEDLAAAPVAPAAPADDETEAAPDADTAGDVAGSGETGAAAATGGVATTGCAATCLRRRADSASVAAALGDVGAPVVEGVAGSAWSAKPEAETAKAEDGDVAGESPGVEIVGLWPAADFCPVVAGPAVRPLDVGTLDVWAASDPNVRAGAGDEDAAGAADCAGWVSAGSACVGAV